MLIDRPNRVEKALLVAFRAHKGQRYSSFHEDVPGEPYINHVIRVADRVDTEPKKVVALLHDLIEDTDHYKPPEFLWKEEFEAVWLLTRPEDCTYEDYIDNILEADGIEGSIAREVKLADLQENLSRLPVGIVTKDGKVMRLRNRYKKAINKMREKIG